jgi:hypothetical protein
MGDKDQSKSPTLHWKSILRLVFHTLTVPGMKPLVIDLPSCNKGISVCHNILTFVSIKIHSIMHGTITPAELLQPVMCGVLRNRGTGNPRPCELLLHDWTRDQLNNIARSDVAALRVGQEQGLKSLQKIFVIKDSPSRLAKMVNWELPRLDEAEYPLLKIACARFTPCPSIFATTTDDSVQFDCSWGSRYRFKTPIIPMRRARRMRSSCEL